MATKTCKGCGQTKPEEEFSLSSSSHARKDGTRGRRTRCKVCYVTYAKQYNKKIGKVERAAQRRRWRQKNPAIDRLYNSRQTANRNGYMPCAATPEEVSAVFTGACHGCRYTEKELGYRLLLVYDRKTGDFRGWLCKVCKDADVLGEGQVATRHPL